MPCLQIDAVENVYGNVRVCREEGVGAKLLRTEQDSVGGDVSGGGSALLLWEKVFSMETEQKHIWQKNNCSYDILEVLLLLER